MGSPGGYQVNPGLYRVPDLLTEQQFVDYMLNTYGRKVEFTDGETISPARALGRSHPVGVVDEVDEPDQMSPAAVNDPHLRRLNEMNFGPNYASTVTPEGEVETENEESPVDSVVDEPGVNKEPEVSVAQDAPPIPVDEAKKRSR
jgi:hypothetical protein